MRRHDTARARRAPRGWDRLATGWTGPSLLALGALGAVALTNLLDFGAYDMRYAILNANSSASWSHGVVAGALALGAIVCLLGAVRLARRRLAWVLAAAILALFFADEVSGLHAHIDALSSADAVGYGKLLYAPILIGLVVCLARLQIGAAHARTLWAGAALLLASYAIHVLNPHDIARHLGWSADSWPFEITVALKEGFELAGMLVMLAALAGAAFARGAGIERRGRSGARRLMEGEAT